MGLVCVRDATVCTPMPQSYTDQQPGQEYAGASRHPGIPAVQVTPMILPDESHAGYGSVAAATAASLLRTGFIDGQIAPLDALAIERRTGRVWPPATD